MGSLDADWLRARVEGGATAREIAAEAGCHPRTVRNWLHRYKIQLPRERRNQQVTAAVLADYRAGVKMAEIAAGHRVSTDWIAARVRAYGVTRDVPVTRTVRRYRFPQLEDGAWLRARLEEAGIRQVARDVGTSPSTVRAAIRRHGIDRPPWRATPLERAQWEPDPVVRYELAAQIAADAKATRNAAQRTLRAAERIMKQARRDDSLRR